MISPLAELIEASLAGADPDQPAIVEGSQTTSYRELASASGRLAARLAGSGPVAVALPRGTDAIVAMLGCLRSGRPYLPVNPDDAVQVAEILLAAGPTTVVSAAGSSGDWPGLDRIELPSTGGQPIEIADHRPLPDDQPGYLLATSGSTGRPKLVRGSAPALANYLRWQRDELHLGPDDVLSNTADPWFDFSFKETLGALTAGACIAVAPPPALATGESLLAWLGSAQPSTVCLLPSRLALLVAAIERTGQPVEPALARLRWLLVSGEPFPAQLFRRWRAVAPRPVVLNLYGPTESTVIKLRQVLPPGARVETDTVPVGTPIAGTRVELAGETGELCLVSDDLALGYLGDQAGTTRFELDSLGRRCLRTGDLARVDEHGAVELLGRVDQVVKRNGVKVSLPAIEAAAAALAQVQAAAAVDCLHQSADGASRMVIVLFCVLPAGAPAVSLRELRGVLLSRLGFAQMPDQLRFVESLPLDGRGKVDRSALRQLSAPVAAP